MKSVFVRSPYNYDMDKVSEETGLKCLDPSMAQQQFLEESDINTIVERFGLNGEVPELVKVPQYGDYSEVTDFHSAMNAVRQAEASFMELPAKVRSRFGNDPQQFLEFVSDDKNIPEARDLGLLPPAPIAPLGDPVPAAVPASKS